MSERYTRLCTLPENLYLDGSPVLISAATLLKDNKTGAVLAQIKLQNLCHSTMTACKVHIRAFDPSGVELRGVDSHSYLDLSAQRGEYFGSREAIPLPDSTTRKIAVSVTQTVLGDGTVWDHEPADWTQPDLKRQKIRDILQDYELQKQFSIEAGWGSDIEFVPETVGSLTVCTCGALNLTGDEKCHSCNRNLEAVFSAMDMDTLTKKKDARLAEEEAERIRQEKYEEEQRKERERKAEEERREREQIAEEQRIAAEKARKKRNIIIVIIASAVAVAAAAVLVVTKVIIPENKYKAAEALLDAQDYDGAIAAFTELGDYKDSAERIENVPYVRAEDMLAAGDYDDAIIQFKKLGDYSDAADRVNEVSYLQAEALLQDGEYESAIRGFKKLGDYSDAAERVNKTKLMYANVLVEGKEYAKAKAYLEELGSYGKANERLDELNETVYQAGSKLFSEKNYDDSYSMFSLIQEYRDSTEKLQEIYDLVTSDAFESYNSGNYADSYDKFVAIKDKYPIIAGKPDSSGMTVNTYISDYSKYLDVKEGISNAKTTGKRFDLKPAFNKISSLSNKDLKDELLSMPIIRLAVQLQGTWQEFKYRYTFISYGDILTFSDGNVMRTNGEDSLYPGETYSYDFYYAHGNYYLEFANKYQLTNITETSFDTVIVGGDKYLNGYTQSYRKVS